jgi:hypothetical protein
MHPTYVDPVIDLCAVDAPGFCGGQERPSMPRFFFNIHIIDEEGMELTYDEGQGPGVLARNRV